MRSSTTSRLWQRIVGQPSWAISGRANSANVSESRTTCVRARSSSRNSHGARGAARARRSSSVITRHRQPVAVEQLEPAAHQHVVVRLVAGRAAQLVDAGALGDGDPDLRQQHALDVERDQRRTGVHRVSPPRSRSAGRPVRSGLAGVVGDLVDDVVPARQRQVVAHVRVHHQLGAGDRLAPWRCHRSASRAGRRARG